MAFNSPLTKNCEMDVNTPSLLSCKEAPVVLFAPGTSDDVFKSSVQLSRGTCLAQSIDRFTPIYLDTARAPIPDWRLATQEENSVLWATAPPPAYRGVGIVRLMRSQLLRLFEGHSDVFQRAADKDTLLHPLINMLLEIISKTGIIINHVYSARIGRDEPNRITMTKAVDKDARIGLHVDSWDQCAFDDLQNSSNRLSINLGPTDRYFIFVNLTASHMNALLKKTGVNVESSASLIGKSFMSTFPNYPVVRVRLRPGEAYIAPTENILHDGSSAGVGNVNHYLSLRGRFDFI